jgi:ArsR family transcriptional regulator, arsenate/arsenite/antimonite-responsive transcriptional repressor
MEDPMTLTLESITRKPGARCCGEGDQQQLSSEAAQQFTDDLLILAHPVRIQILTMLARSPGQVCVCDLEAALPVKQPTVSHHLKLLRDAGLIDCERHGLFAYYFVNRTALATRRSRILEPLDQLA